MANKKQPTESKLQNVPLDDQTLMEIGRLIRAVAEIEDIVTLYIASMVKTNEASILLLLGRTQISAKLEQAGYMAQLVSPDFYERHKKLFGEGFQDALCVIE